jgi:RimJ/RimL family protein N-acetyltransferase
MSGALSWSARPAPDGRALTGRFVRLERLTEAHAADLALALSGPRVEALYTYMAETPPAAPDEVVAWVKAVAGKADPLFYAAIDPATGKAIGRAALMRIDAANGVIEVGAILWSPALQRTPAASEAIYLFARHVFEDLGYRRFEWKCNALNEPSRRAALRFGFSYEGLFRQHMVVKGLNRDTTWYAMLDGEWPTLKFAFETWLDAANFDTEGGQISRLGDLTAWTLDQGGVRLRRARVGDQALVEAAQADAYARTARDIGTTPIPLKWDYGALLRETEIWLAEDGAGPLGCLVLRLLPDHIYLESIGTCERAAGGGLGGALMDAVFARARALGRPTVKLLTSTKNKAIPWYIRRGFTIYREDPIEDRVLVYMSAAV